MPFVSTGFPALDQMLAGDGECAGFPRGSLTLIGGGVGSGKSQIMRECCSRAHKRGLKVVYLDSEDSFKGEYPTLSVSHLDVVYRLMAQLLHPGKKDKTDLLVLDSLTHMVSNGIDPMQSRSHALQLVQLFNAEMGQTSVVGTLQSQMYAPHTSRNRPSAEVEVGSQASIILNVLKNNSGYHLELVKSKVSTAGVSCEIRPRDMEYFDRSMVQTRYQRILRGRYQTPHF